MRNLYEVIYNNTTDGQSAKHYVEVYEHELRYEELDSLIISKILNLEHMYHGDHEKGHGEFTVTYKRVSREPDEVLNERLNGLIEKELKIGGYISDIFDELETKFEYI